MKNSRILRRFWKILYKYLHASDYQHNLHFNLFLGVKTESKPYIATNFGRLSMLYVYCRSQVVEDPEWVEAPFFEYDSLHGVDSSYFPKSFIGDEEAFTVDYNTNMHDIELYIDQPEIKVDWGILFSDICNGETDSASRFWENTRIKDCFTMQMYFDFVKEIEQLYSEINLN